MPFYGCWGDDRGWVYLGGPDNKRPADDLQPVMRPNPKDVRIAELEAEVARLRGG